MIEHISNHIWQSTVFAFAIALLTIFFRRNRAQVRFGLWFCASLKFFLVAVALCLLVAALIFWIFRLKASAALAPAVAPPPS